MKDKGDGVERENLASYNSGYLSTSGQTDNGGAAIPSTKNRASTHSIPFSYAYGAPSIGSPVRASTPTLNSSLNPSLGTAVRAGRSRMSSRGAVLQDDAALVEGNNTTVADDQENNRTTGRARESAAVRYARIAQQKKDAAVASLDGKATDATEITGPMIPSTSAATKARAGKVTNARRFSAGLAGPLPVSAGPSKARIPLGAASKDTSVNIATAFATALSEDFRHDGKVGRTTGKGENIPQASVEVDAVEEEEAEASGKETHRDGGLTNGRASKKRKKLGPSKVTGSQQEDVASDGPISDPEISSRLKRLRTDPEAEDEEREVVEQADRALNEGEEEESNSRKRISPRTRRKKRDAAYRPTSISGADTDEDSEHDGIENRRQSRRRMSAGSKLGAIPLRSRNGENNAHEKEKRKVNARHQSVEDLEQLSENGEHGASSTMSSAESDGAESDHQNGDYDSEDSERPAASYFLRPQSPYQDEQTVDGLTEITEIRNEISVGSGSLDESGVRGSDYDFSEEDRIVALLEERRKRTPVVEISETSTKLLRRIPNSTTHQQVFESIVEEEQDILSDHESDLMTKRSSPLKKSILRLQSQFRNPLLDWPKILKTCAASLILLVFFWSFLLPLLSFAPSVVRSRSPRNIEFLPPDSAAVSFHELSQRLSALESAFKNSLVVAESERVRHEHNQDMATKMQSQIAILQEKLDSKSREVVETQTSQVNLVKQNAEHENILRALRSDIQSLSADASTLTKFQKDDAELKGDFKKQIQSVKNAVETTEQSLGKLRSTVDANDKKVKAQSAVLDSLDGLEGRILSQIPVRLNPGGKLNIDPKFSAEIDAAIKRQHPSSTSQPSQAPNWEEFYRENQGQIHAWLTDEIEQRLHIGTLISKQTLADTMSRELKKLKKNFDEKANENIQKIGEELVGKFTAHTQKKKQSAPVAISAGSALRSHDVDGQEVTDILGKLVDTALVRYSKDILARPDYALYTAGARVIPSLTSPTYEARPHSASSKVLAWITGTGSNPGRPPVTALHPDINLGSCWPFAGNHGQIGILLSRRIVPIDFTIEHASVDVALDGEVASAPKDFEVWGVVDDPDHIASLARYRESQPGSWSGGTDASNDLITSVPSSPNHILLATGSYDVAQDSPIQSFPATALARELAIPVNVVILKILSNHGDPHYTCLYRIRVGGKSVNV